MTVGALETRDIRSRSVLSLRLICVLEAKLRPFFSYPGTRTFPCSRSCSVRRQTPAHPSSTTSLQLILVPSVILQPIDLSLTFPSSPSFPIEFVQVQFTLAFPISLIWVLMLAVKARRAGGSVISPVLLRLRRIMLARVGVGMGSRTRM